MKIHFWPIPIFFALFTGSSAFGAELEAIILKDQLNKVLPQNVGSWLDPVEIPSLLDDQPFHDELSSLSGRSHRQLLLRNFDSVYENLGSQTISQITTLVEQGQFSVNTSQFPNFSFSTKNVWYHIKLENRELKNRDLIFTITGTPFDVEVFRRFKSETRTVYRGGMAHLPANRGIAGIGLDHSFELKVRENQKFVDLFIRANTFGEPHGLNFRLETNEEFTASRLKWTAIQAFYLGIVFALFIYNAAILVISRETLYFYYICYVACFSIYCTVLQGIYFSLEKFAVSTIKEAINIGLALTICFLGLYVREFLKTKEQTPGWDKILKILVFSCFMTVPAIYFLDYALAVQTTSVVGILTILFILVMACKHCLLRNKQAYFFVIAFLLPIAAGVLKGSISFGFFEKNIFWDSAIQYGSGLELLLLSIAMGDKIRTLLNKINNINLELKRYIGQVEQLVDEKTRHVLSMLASIKQGIITIQDPEKLIIHQEYSREMENLLESKVIGNSEFETAVLQRSDLSVDDQAQIIEVLRASLNESSLFYDVNSDKLANEFNLLVDNKVKNVEVDWNPIPNDSGIIEQILVCFRDVTKTRELNAIVETQKTELKMIGELLNIDEGYFLNFVESTHESINHFLKSLIDGFHFRGRWESTGKVCKILRFP